MYNAVEGGLEETIVAADRAGNAAELLEVVAYGLDWKAVGDGVHQPYTRALEQAVHGTPVARRAL